MPLSVACSNLVACPDRFAPLHHRQGAMYAYAVVTCTCTCTMYHRQGAMYATNLTAMLALSHLALSLCPLPPRPVPPRPVPLALCHFARCLPAPPTPPVPCAHPLADRLFNLDVFEYLLDHPMGVYGSVPFLQTHGPRGSRGLLWLNPSETFVDLGCADGGRAGSAASEGGVGAGADGSVGAPSAVCSHWFSASGTIDAFLFSGPAPHQVTRQHAALTGVTPLPPLFALGYHQCRWNYRDEGDVSAVHAAFEEEGLPFDVLWWVTQRARGVHACVHACACVCAYDTCLHECGDVYARSWWMPGACAWEACACGGMCMGGGCAGGHVHETHAPACAVTRAVRTRPFGCC